MTRSIHLFFAAMLLSCAPSLVGQSVPDSSTLRSPQLQAFASQPAPPLLPSGSLTTLFAGGNNFHGNMFDVQTTSKITITSFDINVSTSVTAEVYYKLGTSVGFETNPGAWTLLGSAFVTSLGPNVPTPLPVGGLTLEPGQRYGLYVTLVSGTMYYSNGTTDYSNSDLTIYHGFGKSYPFGSTFSPRIWNGTIFYNIVPAYDTSFLDDAGASLICFNSTTGDFQWNVLSGPSAGNTYTGTSMVTKDRLTTELVTPFGVLPSLNLNWNTRRNSATAILSPTGPTAPSGSHFSLSDANTTNNPPSPCLPVIDVRSISTSNK